MATVNVSVGDTLTLTEDTGGPWDGKFDDTLTLTETIVAWDGKFSENITLTETIDPHISKRLVIDTLTLVDLATPGTRERALIDVLDLSETTTLTDIPDTKIISDTVLLTEEITLGALTRNASITDTLTPSEGAIGWNADFVTIDGRRYRVDQMNSPQ